MLKPILIVAVLASAVACGSQNESAVRNASVESGRDDRSPVNGVGPDNSASPAAPVAEAGKKIESEYETEFENGIPAGWRKIDPEPGRPSGFETADGGLNLRIPSGKDLFGENMTAPRLVRSISGDFEIETRVSFDPRSDYQGAGLIIFRNDNNFLRLERGFGGAGGGESGIRFDRSEDEAYEPIATPAAFPTSATDVELKFRRKGRTVTAFWREPGKGDWTVVARVTNTYPETVVAGLLGVSTADGISAGFRYVRLRPLKP